MSSIYSTWWYVPPCRLDLTIVRHFNGIITQCQQVLHMTMYVRLKVHVMYGCGIPKLLKLTSRPRKFHVSYISKIDRLTSINLCLYE